MLDYSGILTGALYAAALPEGTTTATKVLFPAITVGPSNGRFTARRVRRVHTRNE